MSIDWQLVRKQRLMDVIQWWLDSSHEEDPRLPSIILAEKVEQVVRQVEEEECQYRDELNSHYQRDSDGEPEFP